MQTTKQIYSKRLPVMLAALALSLLANLTGLLPAVVHASAGTASFVLSPSSGSYTVGKTFTLKIYETSQAGDNVAGVQANLSYGTAYLRCNSVSVSGSIFNLAVQNTCSNGLIQIGEATTQSSVSGQQFVGSASFTVLAAGNTNVSIATSGSPATDIRNGSGSIWNGVHTSASFTLSKPVQSGGGSTGSGSKSSGGATGSTSKPSTTPTTGTMAVTVKDSAGKPVPNATVTVTTTKGTSHTANTNAQGIATFNSLPAGSYTVSVANTQRYAGATTTTIVTAGKNAPVTLKLASNTTPTVAAPSATLTITVTDSAGKPVKGAKVAVGSSGDTAYTNAQGIVLFSGIAKGTYTVTVTAPGKKPMTQQVILAAGQGRTVSLKLANSSSFLPLILYAVIGLLVLAGAGFGWMRVSGKGAPALRLPLRGSRAGETMPAGSAKPVVMPATPSTPVQPDTASNTPTQPAHTDTYHPAQSSTVASDAGTPSQQASAQPPATPNSPPRSS